MSVLIAVVVVCLGVIVASQEKLDRVYWEKSAKADLEDALKTALNTDVAKNVIIFVGDGMGPNTITASRIYRGGETSYLSWERFPHFGALKTYAENKQVPDSASTATAMFTGVKVNYRMIGVDSSVKERDCEASLMAEKRLTSIATLAQQAGKATGIVTTTRVTHATPAAMYAHSAYRHWECDSNVPKNSNCKDIARQLIEDAPGKNFNVIMGGGRQVLKTNSTGTVIDPIELKWSCRRTDGRDLINEWAQDKESRNLKYALPSNTKTLMSVDTDNTDYLLGIFSNHHFPFDCERNTSDVGMPSLEQMTTTAVKILKKNKNGFLLMVEGGMIDLAHHRGKARKALHEVLAFNDAINATMKLLQSSGILDQTLVIVTSDHSHTLTISGYPNRGNNILGIASVSRIDGVPYTTLGYANSAKDNYHYKVENNTVVREDPSKVDTTSFDYGAQAGVLQDENTHGGSDVFIYASGPFAHLFHHMHEQNYVAEVVKYAAKLGEYNTFYNLANKGHSLSSSCTFALMTVFSLVLVVFLSAVTL
ncbi:alkaline phosphatase [Halyomorpha halys]|uniref:alkaline phosphatase n=1 Tax=Halyomorpha halys TaxID=286706 RepID=UPI0006D4FEC7|nr:alkaline phosphatase-like [Halyomorpha halys]